MRNNSVYFCKNPWRKVGKRKKSDPLISALEGALDLGEFIPYNRSWDFVRGLEEVKHKIDTLVKDGQAERAVSLYEIFLSGCYEKADEIDDSGATWACSLNQKILTLIWLFVKGRGQRLKIVRTSPTSIRLSVNTKTP
jgi:hypothetical protein